MQFTTKIPILKNEIPIEYNSKILSLGSCFAENIGDKFQYFKFQSETNPFGIIFNPVSIEKIINRVVNGDLFTEEDIFFHNERWQSFEVHSDLSCSDAAEFLTSLNRVLKETKNHLQEATHIIITYGTSWVYRNNESNKIVANCHKVPQKQFTKELLSVEIIQESIQNTIGSIQTLNPNVNFVFTVSPVRHLKDGFVENQRSKSHLITAIHNLLSENCILQSDYFPSYEIMVDELRDYRFYAEDMLHPSQVAINYIWKRFKESSISETVYSIMDAVEGVQKSLQHRPFDPNSESHQKFVTNLKEKITKLVVHFPHMKF
ncbi:GSCFA domain-containing protein [Flavobacterium adhaerens]|uniref:GSCFA domain-containing protein n=1 Tax=Flavobacterium adhaerens TaxID=3149043 RepID=UPI0032B34E86